MEFFMGTVIFIAGTCFGAIVMSIFKVASPLCEHRPQ